MSFKLPDLIIESVIRDGLESVRRDSSIIEDIFGEISSKLGPMMDKKYGDKEVNRITDYFKEKEVSIVQAFSQVNTNLPAVSIQLLDDTESKNHTFLDDFEADITKEITDPEKLAALVVVSAIPITSYDSSTGKVGIDDSINLENVHVNHILEDIDGNEFKIVGGIVNESGSKQVNIEPGSDPNTIGPALIKSSINYEQFEQRGNHSDQRLLLGVHTEDRLLTIYLYTLVKYFLLARKADLIKRGFKLATYSGSDFTRNIEYVEPVFSRYLTVSGLIEDNWTSDKVIPIDIVDVKVLVEKDKAGEDCFPDATVVPDDDDE